MKVLFIAPFNLKIYDGTTIRINGLIKSLKGRCKEIYLLSPTLNEELKKIYGLKWISMKRLRLYLSAYVSLLTGHLADGLLLKYQFDTDLIKDVDADVIHTHWLLSLPLAYGVKKTLNNDAPIIVDLHGSFQLQKILPSNLMSVMGFMAGRFHERVGIKDWRIDAFTVPSKLFKDFIVKRYGISPEKVFVVPDVIDLENIHLPTLNEMFLFRKKLSLEATKIVAYVGSSSYFHGFYDLLMAYRLVLKSIPNAKLLLIVPNASAVKGIIRQYGIDLDSVVLLENIPREEIYKYLALADVAVLPQRGKTQFEYLPSNKLLDYVAAGRFIVGYALQSVKDFLTGYPYKKLVRTNNYQELARAIVEVLQTERVRRPSNSFIKELEEHSPIKIGKKLICIYKKLVRGVR